MLPPNPVFVWFGFSQTWAGAREGDGTLIAFLELRGVRVVSTHQFLNPDPFRLCFQYLDEDSVRNTFAA